MLHRHRNFIPTKLFFQSADKEIQTRNYRHDSRQGNHANGRNWTNRYLIPKAFRARKYDHLTPHALLFWNKAKIYIFLIPRLRPVS